MKDFFTKKDFLFSPVLNKLGAPVLRNIITNSFIHLKRYKNCKPKDDFEIELIKNGIVVIPNFLPAEEFKCLREEFSILISKKKDEDRNLTGIKSITLEGDRFDEFPAMNKFKDNKRLNRLICVGEGLKKIDIQRFMIENTKFGSTENQKQDRNNFFHADIHFHSHKVLYYMSDVMEENGPFTYLKKTHQNNFDRLIYEFKRGRLTNAASNVWRLEENLENKFLKHYFSKQLKNEYKAVGLANTLVVGNVHGFHKVGDALEGKERELIRMTFRHNPMNIF